MRVYPPLLKFTDASRKKREVEEIVQQRQAVEEQHTRQVQVEALAAASPVKVATILEVRAAAR